MMELIGRCDHHLIAVKCWLNDDDDHWRWLIHLDDGIQTQHYDLAFNTIDYTETQLNKPLRVFVISVERFNDWINGRGQTVD